MTSLSAHASSHPRKYKVMMTDQHNSYNELFSEPADMQTRINDCQVY